ncbi:MAG: hypothetical protein ACYCWE_15390 [Eubacteriales bacterium]
MNYYLQLAVIRIHKIVKRLRACSVLLYFILLEKGYIKYSSGSGNQCGTNSLPNLRVNSDTQSDMQSVTGTHFDTQSDTHSDTHSDHIN